MWIIDTLAWANMIAHIYVGISCQQVIMKSNWANLDIWNVNETLCGPCGHSLQSNTYIWSGRMARFVVQNEYGKHVLWKLWIVCSKNINQLNLECPASSLRKRKRIVTRISYVICVSTSILKFRTKTLSFNMDLQY